MKQQFFLIFQIAQILGVNRTQPYKLIADGRLPPPQVIGGLRGYTRETLEQILGYKFDEEAQQFFRIFQVAQILGVKRTHPYKLIADGRLPPLQVIGGLRGYTRKTLEQILGYKIEDEEAQP